MDMRSLAMMFAGLVTGVAAIAAMAGCTPATSAGQPYACPAGVPRVPNGYANGTEARTSLTKYFSFYNARRSHQALEYRTPDEVYFEALALTTPMAA